MRKILLAMLFFAITALPAHAAMYYVSPDGADSNPGTRESAPFKTVSKAAAITEAGDTVLVGSGIYRERVVVIHSGTASARIVFKSRTPGAAVLEGSPDCWLNDSCRGTGFNLNRRSYITLDGFEIRHHGTGVVLETGGNNILRRLILRSNSGQGVQTWRSDNNLIELSQFLDPNPPGRVLRDAVQDYGVNFYFSKNNKVLNNYFFGNHNQAVSFKKGNDGGLVAGNTFEGCLYTCVYLGQNDADPMNFNMVVKGNAFRPAAAPYRLKSPIIARKVDGAIIRGNFIEGVNEKSGVGIRLYEISNKVEVYNNVIMNSEYKAISVRRGATNFKITHNASINTQGFGGFVDSTNKRQTGVEMPPLDMPSAPNPQFNPDFTRAEPYWLKDKPPPPPPDEPPPPTQEPPTQAQLRELWDTVKGLVAPN